MRSNSRLVLTDLSTFQNGNGWKRALAISRKSRCALAQSHWQNIHLKMEMEISLLCDDGL